jgi:peptidoglycan/LPS O-acetylase OafA/YrhL
MENKVENYKYYISGLKGVACLFIMIGHYLGIYKYAQSFTPPNSIIDIINESPFSFLINEGWWLYLFFVISGYLVAKSTVITVKDFVMKSINRFFRFAFPVLFSYFVIYIIYRICGFHTFETVNLFQCDWYQNFYLGSYSIKDIIMGPFDVLIKGNAKFNGPYWVLNKMFVSSIIIYILKYCYEKLSKTKYETLISSILIIVTFAMIYVSPIITACLIGMLISLYESNRMENKTYFAFWTIVITLILYVLPKSIISTFFFGSLIIFVPKIKWLDNIFSSKPCLFLGKISWGIYSFHWPIICSIGALSIIKYNSILGLRKAYAISFLFVLVFAIIMATVFYYTFDKLATYLTKKLDIICIGIISYIYNKF